MPDVVVQPFFGVAVLTKDAKSFIAAPLFKRTNRSFADLCILVSERVIHDLRPPTPYMTVFKFCQCSEAPTHSNGGERGKLQQGLVTASQDTAKSSRAGSR